MRHIFEIGSFPRAVHIPVNTVKVRYIFEPHSERASQAIEKHKRRLQTSKEAGILETVAHFYWQILVCDYTC